MRYPEQYRDKRMSAYGEDGMFQLPRAGKTGRFYNVIASSGLDWDHVSVSIPTERRCPTWEEMCYIKSHFWEDEEAVMQLHPPKSEWVNNHPYCLHLWRPQKKEIPIPDSTMVGLRKENIKENNTHGTP
jgi:hypothetical protein